MTSSHHAIGVLTFHVGNETQVVLEFSPYQKVPTEKSKADNRIATIEEGTPRSMPVPRRTIYVNTTQMKFICHSSSLWKTTIRNHSMRKRLNT